VQGADHYDSPVFGKSQTRNERRNDGSASLSAIDKEPAMGESVDTNCRSRPPAHARGQINNVSRAVDRASDSQCQLGTGSKSNMFERGLAYADLKWIRAIAPEAVHDDADSVGQDPFDQPCRRWARVNDNAGGVNHHTHAAEFTSTRSTAKIEGAEV
jgi:hypothetical protein